MSALEDFADIEAARQAAARASEAMVVARHELRTARAAGAASAARVVELEGLLEQISSVHPSDLGIVPWGAKPPKRSGKAHHATAVLMLSDLHLDEVVNPLELNGLNAYDRRIAEMRLERVVNTAVLLLRDYVAGVELDGLVVALIGDIITGTIHDELARTNEAPVAATIAYWVPRLAGALTYLADELGVPLHVPTVDGNHDRTMQRTPSKQRTQSSNAWIIYNWLADTLRGDDRITFGISVSPHNLIEVYTTRFLLTHGDGFRSAGGVGGIYPSMLKYLHRMHEIYEFDMALMGHWHQYLTGPDWVVNGSLKGYDEYALTNGFRIERPQQALFIVTPEHGVTQHMSVFADSSAEGWQSDQGAAA